MVMAKDDDFKAWDVIKFGRRLTRYGLHAREFT